MQMTLIVPRWLTIRCKIPRKKKCICAPVYLSKRKIRNFESWIFLMFAICQDQLYLFNKKIRKGWWKELSGTDMYLPFGEGNTVD